MPIEKMPLTYFTHRLNARFETRRPFYVMRKPLNMKCYKKLKEDVVDMDIDRSVWMIEQATMFWRGMIGVASSDGDFVIDGEFTAYELLGDYKQMMKIYPQIMKENPEAKTFYTIYLNDPAEVPVEEYKTWILFR